MKDIANLERTRGVFPKTGTAVQEREEECLSSIAGRLRLSRESGGMKRATPSAASDGSLQEGSGILQLVRVCVCALMCVHV